MKKRALAILLLFVTGNAFACSVVIPASERHLYTTPAYFGRAGEVALYQVQSIDEARTPKGLEQKIELTLVQAFKGAPKPTYEIAGIPLMGCGPEYVAGGRYVLFFEHGADGTARISEARGPIEESAGWSRSYLDELTSLSTHSPKP